MFTDFLFALKRQGLQVGAQEWLTLHRALGQGLIENTEDLYGLGRAILVHGEAHYDAYDVAFLEVFRGVSASAVSEAIKAWLADPMSTAEGLDPDAFERATGMSLDELRKRFEEMLEQQRERHDFGSRFIGTAGTSPFGSQGVNPQGIQVGGGGGRSAVSLAEDRLFRNYRTDVTLDVRQFKVALRLLRHLAREGAVKLDIDRTIDKTCKDGGEIDLVFSPDRRNTIRLLLLMDAGGSMSPYAALVDRLFTAASESSHWKSFDHYFFHNCPYGKLYTDIERFEGVPTGKVLRELPPETKVVFVGDACMAPWELHAAGGMASAFDPHRTSGLDWIRRFKQHFDHVIWLNPEPQRYWDHPTVASIKMLLPMFELTLDGLTAGLKRLRQHGR